MIRALSHLRRQDACSLGGVVRRLTRGEVRALVQLSEGNTGAGGAAGETSGATTRDLGAAAFLERTLKVKVIGAALVELAVREVERAMR